MKLEQLNTIIVLSLIALGFLAWITINWVLLIIVFVIYFIYAIWYAGERK